jgi:hypothetical protein
MKHISTIVNTILANDWNWWNGGNSQNVWTQNAIQNAAPASGGSGTPFGDDDPVSAGQISVRAEVSVTFALK